MNGFNASAIWPFPTETEIEDDPNQPRTAVTLKGKRCISPLTDLAAARLLDTILLETKDRNSHTDDTTTMFVLADDTATIIPNSGAQATLRQHLLARAFELHQANHTAQVQLLTLTFAGQRCLPWASFTGLPIAVVRDALQHPGLHEAKSITLCIDTIQGTPAEIMEVLSSAPARFEHLCFLQSPQRTNDDATTELYRYLAESSFLLRKGARITLAGACSASLHNRMWMPTLSTAGLANHFKAFPVQNVFVKLQFGPDPRKIKSFLPVHFHVADALLSPEVFAAGFTRFLYHIARQGIERTSLVFAYNTAILPELTSKTLEPLESIIHGFQVGHPAAENLAIPFVPFVMDRRTRDYEEERWDKLASVQCWPLVRDLVPGSWTVVVSAEDHGSATYSDWVDRRPNVLRYAFLRIGDDGQPNVVGDLKMFLSEMAPDIDVDVVNQKMAELEMVMSLSQKNEAVTRDTVSSKRIRVVDKDEALALLSTFLDDARSYGRDTLLTCFQEGIYNLLQYVVLYCSLSPFATLLRGCTNTDTCPYRPRPH